MDTILIWICTAIGSLLSALCCYWGVYTVLGAFRTRVFPPAKAQHRYAVVIAARNEEKVLANLIRSIRSQDYPARLVEIFVVADNCSDRTAQIARDHGAVCYERFDETRRTKGYALQFLFEQIRRDYGIDAFEGYLVFDADNLLKPDYISRMNEAFDAGERVITSYRNTKNFSDNWISAAWGMHWLRTIRVEHRARSVLRLATRIQGTGLLVGAELLRDGWSYVTLTEDRELSADAVLAGYPVSYCNAAEFYDEQPTSFRIAMRQRIRWSKGHLQVLQKSGRKLLRGIFRSRDVHSAFMTYDMFFICFPRSLVHCLLGLSRLLIALLAWLLSARSLGFFTGALLVALLGFAGRYAANLLAAAYVFLTEHRRIGPLRWWQYLWFTLTFPIFDIVGRYSMLYAMFTKVEWKPIPHDRAVSIEQMRR